MKDTWTDEDFDILGAIGQDPIVLNVEDLHESSVSDAELTEWDTEDTDALDSLTELWTEE